MDDRLFNVLWSVYITYIRTSGAGDSPYTSYIASSLGILISDLKLNVLLLVCWDLFAIFDPISI